MIKYDWIRSNRKTMSIQIKTDGKVIVRTPYGISKSGVLSYTKKLKLKHPEYNIHAITPGSVATGMGGYRTGDDLSYRKNILLRVALPEEIAALSAFLSSDCGKHISNLIVTAAAGEIF